MIPAGSTPAGITLRASGQGGSGSDATTATDRDAREAALKARIARPETAQDFKILELEEPLADPQSRHAGLPRPVR